MESEYLFVYGSLLKQVNNMMSSYLSLKSSLIGEGMMKGRLFMIDFYPGAIYEEEGNHWVKGDIYHMKEAQKIFKVLDEYEGYIPSKPEESLYQRQIVNVLNIETSIPCWVYLYNQDVEPLEWIPSGDYLRYDMKNH
ncbi:MAG: gamma-glutamylcyclotransferase family protein [Bacteroidota bacterium]